jgi:hypothetical protein
VKRPSRIHFQLRLAGVRLCAVLFCAVLCCAAIAYAQNSGSERSFPQSKATIEKILLQMQSSTAGRLPLLDGFALSPSTDRPLDRYQRGYFQSKFQVTSTSSGGSMVRVAVEVTAWYADPASGKSGYQLLPSNGRLEADMLDQLSEQLAGQSPAQTVARTSPVPTSVPNPVPKQAAKAAPTPANEPSVSAPMPRLPEVGSGISASVTRNTDTQANGNSGSKTTTAKNEAGPLETEADNLEEILKNQAHPKNLVAVKKSGTPVVASASLNAKTLFLASAHDEFEMLDYNRDWVHVRISGLSRGWIWRNNLEMPDSVPNTDTAPAPSTGPNAAELYHVSREEVALFPGDWEPLRGKSVKIVSVEQTGENKDSGSQLRLAFAKSVLETDYAELAKKQELAGIVLIFDAADGGMIAATFPILQQWKAGTLSDAALWHQCYFDPPEILTGPSAGASQ